eukprot:CAMPEP_0170557018 /NCGR_PEP_ID=MMETSP0211-20121228/19139_1 /TAXON_ID=311385 /ORGANISM="Pseudokeronopsis sp., Strain OXSARD2" /LENGTH=76 /DNA_ID=CAMNT_0010867701 /DNA_START=409 /DNA_END=639 /DNA_ORIENTATION=+
MSSLRTQESFDLRILNFGFFDSLEQAMFLESMDNLSSELKVSSLQRKVEIEEEQKSMADQFIQSLPDSFVYLSYLE